MDKGFRLEVLFLLFVGVQVFKGFMFEEFESRGLHSCFDVNPKP